MTDGTKVLEGTITNMSGSRLDFPGFNWDVIGTLTMTGGTGLGNMLCSDPLTLNDFIAFRYSAEELGGEDVRDGFVLGLQWRPNDSFDLAFDSYYSDFESTGFARGITIIGPQTVLFTHDLFDPI